MKEENWFLTTINHDDYIRAKIQEWLKKTVFLASSQLMSYFMKILEWNEHKHNICTEQNNH